MAAVATSTTALLLPGPSIFPRTNAGRIAFGHRHRIPDTVPSRLACRRVRNSEPEKEPALFLPQEDLSYLVKLGAGSFAGAAAIKYGSFIFPEITRPNIPQALFTIFLPVIVAVLLLIDQSRKED